MLMLLRPVRQRAGAHRRTIALFFSEPSRSPPGPLQATSTSGRAPSSPRSSATLASRASSSRAGSARALRRCSPSRSTRSLTSATRRPPRTRAAVYAQSRLTLSGACLQVLLAVGLQQSLRVADEQRPYGYGFEVYVWAMISGVDIASPALQLELPPSLLRTTV